MSFDAKSAKMLQVHNQVNGSIKISAPVVRRQTVRTINKNPL